MDTAKANNNKSKKTKSYEPCILITGASSGIGAACARQFAKAGYKVIALGRDKKRLNEIKNLLPRKNHLVFALDMTQESQMQKLKKQLEKELPYGLSIVLANAGINHIGTLQETSKEKIQKVMDINFTANVSLLQICVPLLKKNMQAQKNPSYNNVSKNKKSQIIFVSSIVGVIGVPARGIYCASKWALEGFAQTMKAELKADGIAVKVMRPAGVSTSFHENTQVDGHTPRSNISVKSPEAIASSIYKLAHSNKFSRAPGIQNSLIQFLGRHVPALLTGFLSKRFQKTPRG